MVERTGGSKERAMRKISLLLIVMIATLAAGCCPAATQPRPAGPGQAAHSASDVVDAFAAGVEAAGSALGTEGSSELERARGVLELGRAAVEACELGAGWLQFVRFAIDAVRTLIGLFSRDRAFDAGASSLSPLELDQAMEMLEASAR